MNNFTIQIIIKDKLAFSRWCSKTQGQPTIAATIRVTICPSTRLISLTFSCPKTSRPWPNSEAAPKSPIKTPTEASSRTAATKSCAKTSMMQIKQVFSCRLLVNPRSLPNLTKFNQLNTIMKSMMSMALSPQTSSSSINLQTMVTAKVVMSHLLFDASSHQLTLTGISKIKIVTSHRPSLFSPIESSFSRMLILTIAWCWARRIDLRTTILLLVITMIMWITAQFCLDRVMLVMCLPSRWTHTQC